MKVQKSRGDYAFSAISTISGLAALFILLWVLWTYPLEKVVGVGFVLNEFTFYTPINQFHFKPITLFVIFGFVFWACGLESWRSSISKFKTTTKHAIFILLSLLAFVFGYETIQNFLMWTSEFILTGGNVPIDLLNHQLNPAMLEPVNFTFISKFFSLLLAGSLYGLYFFHRLDMQAERQEKLSTIALRS